MMKILELSIVARIRSFDVGWSRTIQYPGCMLLVKEKGHLSHPFLLHSVLMLYSFCMPINATVL